MIKPLHLSSKSVVYTLSRFFISFLFTASKVSAEDNTSSIKSIAVDNVWSGHRIKPDLLTRGNYQYVAYFDANRQMTVAERMLGKPWRYYKVDSWLGWDSHNYVTMEVDAKGHLHLIGNMHGDALEYFRTRKPYSVRSLERVDIMVDPSLEQRMTYPIFMLNKDKQLLVKYRDGGSGNGSEIYNIYDTETKAWARLHENNFLDGEGLMSGYFEGPTLGPDGRFHLIWVWRNTPNAATNHSLSYARSEDLVNWEDSSGQPIALPLTHATTEIVDPVKPGEGMINGNIKLGFDGVNRPVISYHKYDDKGNTQMYLARREAGGWNTVQMSEWQDFRWEFGGGGSLGRFPIKPYPPQLQDDGTLHVLVRKNDDILRFVVSGETLATLEVSKTSLYPSAITPVTERANQEVIRTAQLPLEHQVFKGRGDLQPDGTEFYLSWFSQPGNRDRAHSVISKPSVLLLHETE